MSVPAGDSDAGGDHRVAHRHKTFEPTIMSSAAGLARIHLINVSETGALVHAARPPACGTRVTITLGVSPVEAAVVWTDGPRFGVAFRRRLAHHVVEALLGGD